MLHALTEEDVPWHGVQVVQVDERVAPAGHPDRNLTYLNENLQAVLHPEQILGMPVESSDLEAAALRYAAILGEIAGSPPVLDLVHLGLGPTAILLLWFREIQCWRSTAQTLRLPVSIKEGAG